MYIPIKKLPEEPDIENILEEQDRLAKVPSIGNKLDEDILAMEKIVDWAKAYGEALIASWQLQ